MVVILRKFIATLLLASSFMVGLAYGQSLVPQPQAKVGLAISNEQWDRYKTVQQSVGQLNVKPSQLLGPVIADDLSWRHALLLNAIRNNDGSALNTQLSFFEQATQPLPAPKVEMPTIGAAPVLAATAPLAISPGLNVPILVYHHFNGDFDRQIRYLAKHGYTSITPDQLTAALTRHAGLPNKPVLITLDDGYTDQLQSIATLRKYNMKGTLYMIVGGPRSNFCLGANRHGGQPCGDSYITWDQLRSIDREGLITIGAHTIDHFNLASLSAADQSYEIAGSKQELEAQLGHSVTSLAYPYGSFNQTSIQLARQAGYTNAVSTIAGTSHTLGELFTLHRVRDATTLP